MNHIDYGKAMEKKLIAWKSKVHDLTRKVANQWSKNREKTVHDFQDLGMPNIEMSSRIERLKNDRPTELTPQRKNINNGFVDMHGKYVLRPRLSYKGLYWHARSGAVQRQDHGIGRCVMIRYSSKLDKLLLRSFAAVSAEVEIPAIKAE